MSAASVVPMCDMAVPRVCGGVHVKCECAMCVSVSLCARVEFMCRANECRPCVARLVCLSKSVCVCVVCVSLPLSVVVYLCVAFVLLASAFVPAVGASHMSVFVVASASVCMCVVVCVCVLCVSCVCVCLCVCVCVCVCVVYRGVHLAGGAIAYCVPGCCARRRRRRKETQEIRSDSTCMSQKPPASQFVDTLGANADGVESPL
jgi:hypothetical protein